jgi:hypothetical protein
LNEIRGEEYFVSISRFFLGDVHRVLPYGEERSVINVSGEKMSLEDIRS